MSLGRSVSGGVSVGAMFGLAGAAASLIVSGGTVALIVPTLAAGSLLGAFAGGAFGASGYMLANAIPGLRHTLGMARTEPYITAKGNLSYRLAGQQQLDAHKEEMEHLHRNVFVPDHVRDVQEEWQERLEAEREAAQGQHMGR